MSGPDGTTITLPAAPTYSGHTFNGWFVAASGGSALSSTYTLAGSTTLYAQWTVNSISTPLTLATLVITAANESVTVGGTVTSSVTVSGLNSGDSGTVSSVIYTYAGTSSTTYGPSTTAPTAVGTYSVTPSGGTVTVTPSSDQANYSSAFGYVASTLTISQASLTVTVASQSVTVGGTVTSSVTVSGLNSGDSGTVSSVIYTYAGTSSTTYGPSTTAPTAVGTYSVTPSGGTVTVTPSSDQANYSSAFGYVASTLTISARVIHRHRVGPYAARVVGVVWTGRTVVVTILGRGFYGRPKIVSSTGRPTIAVVLRDTGTRLTVRVTVKAGTPRGVHIFTITLANGKHCRVRYGQR